MSKIEIFENYRNGELETYTMSKEALGKLIDDVEASARSYERRKVLEEVLALSQDFRADEDGIHGDYINAYDVEILLSKLK